MGIICLFVVICWPFQLDLSVALAVGILFVSERGPDVSGVQLLAVHVDAILLLFGQIGAQLHCCQKVFFRHGHVHFIFQRFVKDCGLPENLVKKLKLLDTSSFN